MPTSSPSDACSSSSEYRYKMILTDSGGDGWGGATFQISTDSTLRFSGTLATGMQREALLSPLPSQCPTPPRSPPISPPGSYAVEYFCLEDGEHTVVVSGGSSTTIDEACFEFDDIAGDSFRGCGAIEGELRSNTASTDSPRPPLPPPPSPPTLLLLPSVHHRLLSARRVSHLKRRDLRRPIPCADD